MVWGLFSLASAAGWALVMVVGVATFRTLGEGFEGILVDHVKDVAEREMRFAWPFFLAF